MPASCGELSTGMSLHCRQRLGLPFWLWPHEELAVPVVDERAQQRSFDDSWWVPPSECRHSKLLPDSAPARRPARRPISSIFLWRLHFTTGRPPSKHFEDRNTRLADISSPASTTRFGRPLAIWGTVADDSRTRTYPESPITQIYDRSLADPRTSTPIQAVYERLQSRTPHSPRTMALAAMSPLSSSSPPLYLEAVRPAIPGMA